MANINRIICTLFLTVLLCISALSQFGEGEHQSGNKHMAAHHYSVVCTGNQMPSSAILTYPINEFRVQDYNFLLKLMPCLVMDGFVIKPSSYEQVEVEDYPGGVKATINHRGATMVARITPLLTGRGSDIWHGAVLYEIETEPAQEVWIYLGGGETINLIWGFESSMMKQDSVAALEQVRLLGNSSMEFTGGKEGIHVGLKTSGKLTLDDEGSSDSPARIKISGSSGYVLTCFSEDAGQLQSLMKMDAMAQKQAVEDYYQNLLFSSIQTPEKVMNEAFTSAIYNLEYSWLEPFGWGECLHHWLALWYMQVTAAADWIGQADRSRSSILAHGMEPFANGAIPMFNPNHQKQGKKRRDWGGANNFWAWQVRHYVKQTGDLEFARQTIPMLDRAIEQTLEEYDPDGNLLIAWGLQIGNQEDFVANPYDGSVPTMELYNMFKTRAELSAFTGDKEAAELWSRKAEKVRKVLYKELWINDLGRFAYYKDPTGRIMPDGQYQTYLYPTIYGLVDSYDQYSGLRHLLDRLTDEQGAVFASNNFPWHVPESVSTWGMQRGAAQQPWAAMGFAAAGRNNMTWKPLLAMAQWAQDPRRPGSWPETGPEPTPAYFTPPAGLYISTVIEAMFGLKPDVPNGYLEVSPSFPDHWPEANLNLPGTRVNYSRAKNRIQYAIESSMNLPLKIQWRLPVSTIESVTVNNQELEYELLPGVNHMIISFEAPASNKTKIIIEFDPVDYMVMAPKSIACGETLSIELEGARIEKVIDRYNVLESIRLPTSGSVEGIIHPNLLDSYQKYGHLGQLNFARRTLFLDCKTPEGINFIAAVDLTLLPRVEAEIDSPLKVIDNQIMLALRIRNNTEGDLRGEANLKVGENLIPVVVDIPPRSESQMNIPVPVGESMPSGENILELTLPGERPLLLSFRIHKTSGPAIFTPLTLPVDKLVPDSTWNKLRVMPGHPHIFFTFSAYGWPRPMDALENISELPVPQVPGLTFELADRNFIPLSHLSGSTSFRFPLEKKKYKKLYLLLLPFVDNHDIFSDIGRVSAYSGRKLVYSKTLSYPGNIDYWVSNRNPTSFATYREERPNPHELLPMLSKEMRDWEEGKPPEFPQSRWWSSSLPLATESCVMTIIEINLHTSMKLDHLLIESLGALPALGIVAITAELSD